MSQTTVRAAVVAWFKPPHVDGLARVFTAPPKIVQGGHAPGNTAIAIVTVAPGRRTRIAVGGEHSGWKRVDYSVELGIKLQSAQRTAEAATDRLDEIVDAAIARLESDRTLGGTVWRAGEGPVGIIGQRTRPQLIGEIVNLWHDLTFEVTEMVQT